MRSKEKNIKIKVLFLFSVVVIAIHAITTFLSSIVIYLLASTGVISYDFPKIIPFLLFMNLVCIAVGVCISPFVSRKPLRPINRIITQMNRLASGDFSARLDFGRPINTHPVFVEMKTSFNKMAEELENTEMLRSDFINNFSHEFKTPIVSIAGFAKLLKNADLTEDERKEYINIIEEESLRLAQMATNVLNLTKVENQSILTDISYFNLSEQIRFVMLLFEDKWTAKDISLCVDFNEYYVYANEDLLKQVWINLIDNAIKFSDNKGCVSIDIRSDDNEYLNISVSNTGNTIPPESIPRIFNKFYQVDESHSGLGNGIGLNIVKRAVELHGGSVTVESQNRATTFTVHIPSVQPATDTLKST
ncbi:MAG: HAMP domain-containing histidine kinase [Clostridiales bacterium]|nr:HAMP domain-containing histidine kinase [Clostridiales bacterium]